jgi:hypothetical protein
VAKAHLNINDGLAERADSPASPYFLVIY